MTRDDEFAALRTSFEGGDWRALVCAVNRLADDEILPHWLETELIACIESKHYSNKERRRDQEAINHGLRVATWREVRRRGVRYEDADEVTAEELRGREGGGVGAEAIRTSRQPRGKRGGKRKPAP
jgi:hypothetical protein